jgi:hypothetical protein
MHGDGMVIFAVRVVTERKKRKASTKIGAGRAHPRVDPEIRAGEVHVARSPVERHRQRAALAGQAAQAGEEVHVPRLPPELAVGDPLEPGRLLEPHRLAHRLVLRGGQRGRVDAPVLVIPPPRLEGGRPEQAAHVVGPERRARRGHGR